MSKHTQKQYGGAGFAKSFLGQDRAAYEYFMSNAESFRILTDSSFCSLTLIAKLPDDIDSPYVSFKPDNASFMQPIRQILIKIIPSHDINDMNIRSEPDAVLRSEQTYDNMVMISSKMQVEKECTIQKQLYIQSIIDPELPLYPICPAILYCENQVENPKLFMEFLNGKIDSYDPDFEIRQIDSFLNVELPKQMINPDDKRSLKFSIIVMEFMDSYDTFKNTFDLWSDIRRLAEYDIIYNKTNAHIILQTIRLHNFGYNHGDLHGGNILVNINSLYATEQKEDLQNTGNALLIDFGFTKHFSEIDKLPGPCKIDIKSEGCIKTEQLFNILRHGWLDGINFADLNLDDLKGKIYLIAISRKQNICAKLGVADSSLDLATIIMQILVGMQHVLVGGGTVGFKHPNTTTKVSLSHPKGVYDNLILDGSRRTLRKSNRFRKNKLFKLVLLNSLRQSGTYKELYDYLSLLQKHTPKKNKTVNRRTTTKRRTRRNRRHSITVDTQKPTEPLARLLGL